MSGHPLAFFWGRRRFGVFALVLCLAAARLAAAPRVVAVGDVHGDLLAFKAILAEAGLVDASGSWTGGDSVFVQLGDLIDRGPSMRGVLDFVMAIEQQAAPRGGRVIALLGNHEVMNIAGDLRYVATENYAEFADVRSQKRRADAWEAVVELRRRRARELGQQPPPTGPDARNAWLAAHPPGYIEQREAFGPQGTYGLWLRRHDACSREQGSVFLHGGLSADVESVDAINRSVRDDLAAFDADRRAFVARGLILPFFDLQETFQALREELAALESSPGGRDRAAMAESAERRELYRRFLAWDTWTMNSPDGPLWFRGYARWSEEEGLARMPRLLAAVEAERLVVGHTVQQTGRIQVRFGGFVYMIDTGMLASHFPGGRASALEIRDGVISAIYTGELRKVLRESPVKKVAWLH